MNVDSLVMRFAGVFILATLALAHWHSPNWLWATAFELDSQQVSVLVFDPAGHLAGQLTGSPTPERLARAAALVGPPTPP